MRLFIRQKGYKYQFFRDNEEEPYLFGLWDRKRKLGLYSKILAKDNKELVAVAFSNNPWFWNASKTKYKIIFHEEKTELEVKAVNYFKGHWTFDLNGDKYDYYFHYGHKKSLFKNGNQVAKCDKGKVHFWNTDSGFIIANNDENSLLLLSLFIMVDMGDSMDGDVNVDLGNLPGGVREYNNYWQPTH